MNGVLLVDKPRGWTSHDVVQKARGILREKKIGHTGTLDPLATGLLVLCVGKATKIIRYLEADDKEYTAELTLGTTTETQDSEGRVVAVREYLSPSAEQVRAALLQFRGAITQRPPAYSALKVNGVPSYRLARSGTLTEHDRRPVTIHAIELLDYRDPVVRFRVRCSKGTYVRALCADVGERLGMGAHLSALTRTRAGVFRLEDAHSLEEIASAWSAGSLAPMVLSLCDALEALPEVVLGETDAQRIVHGSAIPVPLGMAAGTDLSPVRLVNAEGDLVAVAKVRGSMLHPETVVS